MNTPTIWALGSLMKPPENFCVYDNPKSSCRELWRDGVIEGLITRQVLEFGLGHAYDPIPRILAHSQWEDGYVYGNKWHIREGIRP